ncbi:hypothetical protein RYA05_13610 [Pseudomonas syringae pv. actinidiae]|nr:hypothetical protein [Pseudomonas syringae pv. actinidiae]
MKTVTSVLGDNWIVDNNKARPEFGDREFGMTPDMQEMIENAQKSPKWAERLKCLASAELNEDKDAIYVADRKHNNWFRSISLDSPEFRFGEQDYYGGFRLTYPGDTRLKIEEMIIEPGNSAGPYLVIAKGDDGVTGIVGACDFESELSPILESLANQPLFPLPPLSTYKGAVYEIADGYKAETSVSEMQHNDSNILSFNTTVVDPDGKIVLFADFPPAALLSIRDSGEYLQKILGDCADVRDREIQKQMVDLNSRLVKFNTTEVCSPVDAEGLNEALDNLPKNTPLKLMSANKDYEIILSWRQVKLWKEPSGKIVATGETPNEEILEGITVKSLDLCYEREYSVETKQSDGFTVLRHPAGPISRDNLFKILTDPSMLVEREHGSFHQSIIGDWVEGSNDDIEYVSKKSFPLEAVVKKAQDELSKAIASYGLEM